MTAVIERLRELNANAFARCEANNTPVVFEGGARSWPALARWTPDALAERFGRVEMGFKYSKSGVHPDFSLPSLREMFATKRGRFDAFLQAITNGPEAERAQQIFTGDEKFLLRRRDGRTAIDPQLAPLLDDLTFPEVIDRDRLYTVWAWFSGRGPRTSLHYDNNGCHNLNAQIAGRKRCSLIAPEVIDALGLFPLGGPNPAHNCSALDVKEASVPVYTAELEAGDLLFIPAWWLHTFDHLGAFNANINFWWKPAQPIDNAVARRQAEIDGLNTGK